MVNKVIIEFESKSLPAQREGRIPLRLTNDIVFFHVFASDTEQSRKALLSLLNLVLGRKDDPITEILVANSVHKGLQPDEKGIIMDVKAKSRSGEIFIVEMQNRVTEDFKNRVLFYGSRMVNSSLDSGEKYGMMKKSIVISFVNGILFPETADFHTRFLMKEDKSGEVLNDRLEIHFLELGKILKKEPALLSSLEQFCAFVKYAGDEEQEDYVAQLLAAGKETVNMVNEVFKGFTEDEELQELLWRQKIAELDRNSELYRAEEQVRTSIAQKMKEEGFTAETIVKMTGLDAETVEKL